MDNQYQIDILSAMAERTIKRLWILIVILVVLLFGSNVAWIIYESSFVDEVTTVTQTADSGQGGTATINDGVHINGKSDTNSNNETPQEENREGVQEMP